MANEQNKSCLIPIGKMAEMNHMTVAALRLYDEKGLLKPRYVDPMTGYRYYDWNQNARLDMIACMKELGMTLQEIHDVFQNKDPERIEEILVRRNEQLYEQRRILKEQQKSVQRAIQSMERFRKSPVTGMVSLEYIEQRYIWGIPCSGNFYTGGLTSFEQDVARLRSELMRNSFLQILTALRPRYGGMYLWSGSSARILSLFLWTMTNAACAMMCGQWKAVCTHVSMRMTLGRNRTMPAGFLTGAGIIIIRSREIISVKF